MSSADTFVDLSPALHTATLRDLLQMLIGWRNEPDRDRVATEAVMAEYTSQPNLHIFGISSENDLAGVIGVKATGPHVATIQHLVVRPERRGEGLGSRMITECIEHLALNMLDAETDIDAVNFYRRCDFAIASLGEIHPGRERFHCRWTSSIHVATQTALE